MLAPTFFKRQSALMPLLLLSKSQPLALGCDLVLGANLKAITLRFKKKDTTYIVSFCLDFTSQNYKLG